MATKQISLNTEQMPDFQQWKAANDSDFSLWDYLAGVANLEIALAFTKLLLPDFREHEGGIFLKEAFNLSIYEQWKNQLGNQLTEIEKVMNHQHLDDLLPGGEKVGIDNLFYLGQTMAQLWQSRLKFLYPQRNFQVLCYREIDTVVITFYQLELE
ncbi:MAG: hypothetical protein F6J86_28830 [Symploca sp. SIO1B1]|nr:hypothetical protein [Symploca sp. SIO1B1]